MNNAIYSKTIQNFEYQLTHKKSKFDSETTDVWGINLFNGCTLVYEFDDVSTSRDVVVWLIDMLSKNIVEPEQAEYVIEDFIAKTHTFDFK